MLIHSVETKAEAELTKLVEEENTGPAKGWGIIAVSLCWLRALTNNSFLLAVKSALQDAMRATIYFASKTIYVAWTGMRRLVAVKLQKTIGGLLQEPAAAAEHVQYLDPLINGNELIERLRSEAATAAHAVKPPSSKLNYESTQPELPSVIEPAILCIDARHCRDMPERKRRHAKVSLLVIEDQPFLRKLLFEVLHVNYTIHLASTLKEGLELYLKEAPHIVLLDIDLPDGSGHALAQKLHEIDPSSYVVMVTGSRELADVTVAKKNGVHGFILKPFSKGKILDAVQAYITHNAHLIGVGSL